MFNLRNTIAIAASILLHLIIFYVVQLSNSVKTAQVQKPIETFMIQAELVNISKTPLVEKADTAPQPESDVPPAPDTKQDSEPIDQENTLPIKNIWIEKEASVVGMPEIEPPSETMFMSASLEIEVTLDKNGKPKSVKVISESPAMYFSEWLWEMGMQGTYQPRITPNGPVESKIRVHFDITPGLPMVRR